MDFLQLKLNDCLRKTVVFNYRGEKCSANLNLTLNYLSSLKCENEDFAEDNFSKIERYLKDEGFFEL